MIPVLLASMLLGILSTIAIAASGVHSATMSIAPLANWASGIASNTDRRVFALTQKVGQKEGQIRALREARIELIRRSDQNRKLLKGKSKVKAVAEVVRIKAAKRP